MYHNDSNVPGWNSHKRTYLCAPVVRVSAKSAQWRSFIVYCFSTTWIRRYEKESENLNPIHSVSQHYLLSTYYVPCTVLGTGGTIRKQRPCPLGIYILVEGNRHLQDI